MRFDLHVHTTCSPCSVLKPAEILAHARARGLDGVCITDHDTTDILSHISEGFQPDGLFVVVGMEYTTRQGDFLVFGDVGSLSSGMHARQLLDRVGQMGGAVVAAHPFRGWRPVDPVLFTDGLCTIAEVSNGRNTVLENDQALSLADRFRLTRVAGSDAHSLDELGRCPTVFTAPIASTTDLVNALNHGHCMPLTDHRKVA